MDKKVRIDLSSPPPVPTEELPKAPAAPVEQAAVKEEPKPKKRGGMVLGILAGVAAAAVLLGGYRFVHFWSEPTCTQKARCSICGLEQGDYAAHTWQHESCETPMICAVCGGQQEGTSGHEWAGGSCTEPGTCIHCGETELQARGHSWQDGSCTVCGAEQTNGLLSWRENDGHDLEVTWIEADRALVLRDASLQNFAQMSITIRDYQSQAVSKDSYTVERSDDAVQLNLPRNLAPGRYVIHAGVQEAKVMEFWFGTNDSWMPDEADQWLSDFVLSSRNHGLYLARFEEEAPLRGVLTGEEATRFATPWQMCGGKYQDADELILVQSNADLKFVVDQYRWFDEGGEETACVFRYDNWYLTMNRDGEVSMTDTLDEGCFWSIDSSL